MSFEDFADDSERELPAQRHEARGDAAGAAALRRKTLQFVRSHLRSETDVERRIDRAFAVVEDAMTPEARLIVEMDASAVDVQLIIRLLDSSAASTPFGLAGESGQIEIWIRLNDTSS